MVVTAHIDAKNGTPGAIDNASGVVVLLLLAELLEDVTGKQVEIVALNGEDYYTPRDTAEIVDCRKLVEIARRWHCSSANTSQFDWRRPRKRRLTLARIWQR